MSNKEPEEIVMELLIAEDGNVSPNHSPHEQNLHINQALAQLDGYYRQKYDNPAQPAEKEVG